MKDFSKVLGIWYLKNGRNLPWRTTKNPYFIWLSEVILQQTRVEQGLPYYERFIEHFPEIIDLAEASQDKILHLWQGLGYYSRARNLHSAAKQIINEFNGQFPDNFEQIRSLKGIGDYTAAAIASFAFDLPHAVVDGNVYRFLSRLFGIHTPIDSSLGKKEFALLADKLLDKKHPARHNQAMMEMGATICKPVNPICIECPFAGDCVAYNKGVINQLPVKEKKLKVRIRYFNYLIIHDSSSVVISSRKEKDIWQGLFEFPLIESDFDLQTTDLLNNKSFLDLTRGKVQLENSSELIKHLLSHQTLFTRFRWLKVKSLSGYKKNNDFKIIPFDDLKHFGMPQLIVKYLDVQLDRNLKQKIRQEEKL